MRLDYIASHRIANEFVNYKGVSSYELVLAWGTCLSE